MFLYGLVHFHVISSIFDETNANLHYYHTSSYNVDGTIDNKSVRRNRISQNFELFYREGVPKILQNDDGSEFASNIIRVVMPKLEIKLINGAHYSPTSQGLV